MTEPVDEQGDRSPITYIEVPFTEVRYAEIQNELRSVRRALADLTAIVDRLAALIPPLAPSERDLPPTSARAIPSPPAPPQPAAPPVPSPTAAPSAEAPAPAVEPHGAEAPVPPAQVPAPAAESPTSPPLPARAAPPAPAAPAAPVAPVAPAAPVTPNPVDAILGESFGRPT